MTGMNSGELVHRQGQGGGTGECMILLRDCGK